MLIRYQSPHPNYAHQLFVTPSKHVHVLKDGRLKWQSKAMEVRLQGIASADREHVVYFLLADHCSAAFYAEVHSSRRLPSAKDFLLRAWGKKDDHFFHGLPQQVQCLVIVGSPCKIRMEAATDRGDGREVCCVYVVDVIERLGSTLAPRPLAAGPPRRPGARGQARSS